MTPNPFSKEPLLFSIITPCYKENWKFLDKYFEALATNNYTNIEVIIVFDGPNIKGIREAERLIKKYPNLPVQYFVIQHGGAPKARNYGVSKSTGDILVFLDPDMYIYPESLQMWANIFEEKSHINRVWGWYDIKLSNSTGTIGGTIPVEANGKPIYEAFKFSNYCSGTFPVRREAFVGWDETVVSLQDWDMAIRMLKTTNYKGTDWHYVPHSFFLTEPPRLGGLSNDSHQNWLERVKFVKDKNSIPLSDICVVSMGAPSHGMAVAKILGADYLSQPSFKPHTYKLIYLIGFYTNSAIGAGQHLSVFAEPGTVKDLGNGFVEIDQYGSFKKVIHWIGSDVLQLHWNNSYQKLKAFKDIFKEQKVINLSEFKPTHDELEEIGIESTIVPLPPRKLYDPLLLPKKFSIGIYENSTQNMYREKLMEQVARAMPDIDFYFFGDQTKKGQKTDNATHLGFISMEEWMPKFSCCLRVTIHDGLPLGPVEFMTAGRNVVTNVKLEGTINVEADLKSVIEGIRKAQKVPLDKKWGEYWKKKLDHDKFAQFIKSLV